MRIRTRPAALMGALALSMAMVAPVASQEASEPVPYLDDQGSQLGTILIREFADPYTEHDPGSPPGEGTRYALLTLTFEAAEDQAFAADPYQVQLQDTNGFLHYAQYVPRPADSVVPDLQSQTLAPFDRISGHIAYVLPAEAEIARIVYRGDGRRIMPIADVSVTPSVAIGEPKVITDVAGTPFGGVTLREVTDPFLDFDPNGPPAEGHRYVLLDMVFDAADDQAIQASPASVGLIGSNGMMYWPAWVPRLQPFLLQNLESQPLSPGDRISGVVGFLIPQDVEIDSVVYNNEGNRFLPLADL